MRIFRIGIVLAFVLAFSCGAAWSAQLSWQSFLWENQPLSGYTCASTTVNASNQLQQTLSAVTKYTALPANPTGEKVCAAKLVGGDGWTLPTLTQMKTRVFDPVYSTNAGWVIWVKDDSATPKWFGVGRRTLDAPGYVRLWEHNGTAWSSQNLTERGTDGNNYFTTTIGLISGTVYVKLDYVKLAGSATVYATGTLTYGNISEIYLWASCATTDYKTFKWTEFSIPEPTSLLALAAGLPMVGFALRRKRA